MRARRRFQPVFDALSLRIAPSAVAPAPVTNIVDPITPGSSPEPPPVVVDPITPGTSPYDYDCAIPIPGPMYSPV